MCAQAVCALRSPNQVTREGVQVKDREFVAQRMREHVRNPEATPLLVFPEGTCVNNEYTVRATRCATLAAKPAARHAL
jgi:DTW domain-containing protein YfiP